MNDLSAVGDRSSSAVTEGSAISSGSGGTAAATSSDCTPTTSRARSVVQEQLSRTTSLLEDVHPCVQATGGDLGKDSTSDLGCPYAVTVGRTPHRELGPPPSGGGSATTLNTGNSEVPAATHLPQQGGEHELNLDACIHPKQVAFLTGIGEMVRQHARQHRQQNRATRRRDDASACSSSCSDTERHAARLSVGALISAEGQRVRMHLVQAAASASSSGCQADSSSSEKRSCEGICGRYQTAFSLCTIISAFQPRKASYWQDDHLVEPYHGESYGPIAQRSRFNKSDDNSVSGERDDDVNRSGPAADGGLLCNAASSAENGDYNDENFEPADGAPSDVADDDRAMRSYGKMLIHNGCRSDNVFSDAFFLDKGNITGGERRKKLIVLHSYRASVISFVDKKVLKKDINNHFYVQHPELEVREIKLTHMRAIRTDLLNLALEENSPVELATVAYANWYFERLIMRGMVGKRNRRLALAVCLLLAIKFVETGDVHRKIQYLKARIRHDDAFKGVTWQKTQEWEFCAYVGLEFTLLPSPGNRVVETHLERLLAQVNLTSQEYYSKKFAWP
ncbi:cyclin dependent kinase-binding protein, putative [Trypanosoma equiperdum]|uniref:Cyclin dependent kinase-binding protein, putative n=2 Tax=Trypanozoon TaxID=39700 RepID=Q383C8_TRYB2|nr:cyclin dependent kinase-binding protein, putative [Trypanosoma brucei brucei TREU927]EAN80103.1 cyclin dependent kinase-binding protein, putative [Trypanosoma brucei brucei TREU927]SCU68758.1 cyclin dependent kinase-binding protein, putative [Trypanosoma equiperdum]